MVKNIVIIILVALSSSSIAQSYDRSYLRNEIKFGYGLVSTDLMQKFTSPNLDSLYPDKRYVRDNFKGSGIISISYNRISGNELFLIGASISYNNSKSRIYHLGNDVGELQRNYLTAAVELNYRYQNLNKVQIYSGLGIGYKFGTEKLVPSSETGLDSSKSSINSVAWHINAIGIRVGSRLGAFFELGYGYKGIINAGASFQIN